MEEQALLICSFLYPHNSLSNFGHIKYVISHQKTPRSRGACISNCCIQYLWHENFKSKVLAENI
jgi:hypothetical protein